MPPATRTGSAERTGTSPSTRGLRTGGYYAKSSTPGINGEDYAGSADLYWDSRNARLHYTYTQIGKGFNDELGFITRTDVRDFRTDNYWILWPDHLFKQAWFVYDLDYITDLTTGQLQTRINHGKFSGYFTDGSGIAFKFYDEVEVLTTPLEIKTGLFIPPGSYHFGHSFIGYQSDYTKPFGWAGRFAWGDYYDGDIRQSFLFLTYRPIPGLYTALTIQDTKVYLKEGSFTSDIALGEITYAFNNRLAASIWVQWDRTPTCGRSSTSTGSTGRAHGCSSSTRTSKATSTSSIPGSRCSAPRALVAGEDRLPVLRTRRPGGQTAI